MQTGSQDRLEDVQVKTRNKVADVGSAIVREGKMQITSSLQESKKSLRKSRRSIAGAHRAFWAFLSQPVWVVKKKKQPKKYSRFSLFFFDTIRFGATFAFLFIALFTGLNYQSYWQITKSHFNPLQYKHNELQASVANTYNDKLGKVPSLVTAGSIDNPLNYLPAVGPPDKRIVIPKLDLNVPIKSPTIDSLIAEDWEQLELDIQSALEQGVVHYPGTARPGQAGNFFVTGHSSYYPWSSGNYKTIFARLHELEVGDEYWVYFNGDQHRYIIADKKEVLPSDVSVLDQPTGQRISTLMTCTPIGTTLRRLVLQSVEVHPETGLPMDVGENFAKDFPKLQVHALPI